MVSDDMRIRGLARAMVPLGEPGFICSKGKPREQKLGIQGFLCVSDHEF